MTAGEKAPSTEKNQTGRVLNIDGFEISDESDCYVIAEIGANHQGDLEKCKALFEDDETLLEHEVMLQHKNLEKDIVRTRILKSKKRPIAFNSNENFLKEIGYLVKEGNNFSIETKNVETEISSIAGPQLVVPVMNARYSLNAANARWGSLYNALYGTDVISEADGAQKGEKYNYIRGEKVIEYARDFLDVNVPLKNHSWKDISEIPKVENNQLSLKLKNINQFIGYNKKSNNLSSLLFINNNLHIDVLFNPNQTRGGLKDKGGI